MHLHLCASVSHLGKGIVMSAVFSLSHFSQCKEPILPQFGDRILQGNPFCYGGHHDVTKQSMNERAK